MSDMETVLRETGVYIAKTEGYSMFPMLTPGTKVVIRKPVFPLKKYDIPVYPRGGRYSIHRVVRVTKTGYVICGDNNAFLERDITEKDIVGVLYGVYRDGRLVKADDEELLAYGRKACRNYPIRVLRRLAGRVRRKLAGLFR